MFHPKLHQLMLHPAVLIASGYESLSSSEVRFLHAMRQHFCLYQDKLDEAIVVSPNDFNPGGIGNPYHHLDDPSLRYQQCARAIDHFPYISRMDLFEALYRNDLQKIWQNLLHEVIAELDHISRCRKVAIDGFRPTTEVVHKLYGHSVYQKICALHICGLGQKMMDAFSYVFDQYRSLIKKEGRVILN